MEDSNSIEALMAKAMRQHVKNELFEALVIYAVIQAGGQMTITKDSVLEFPSGTLTIDGETDPELFKLSYKPMESEGVH